MGNIYTKEISNFGGMTSEIRSKTNECALCLHFDLYRNRTLAPNRTYTAITDGSEKITRFLYAKQGSATNYAIYGMGDALGASGGVSGYPAVYYKTPTATVWTDGVALAQGSLNNSVFVLYKDCFFGWQANGVSSTLRYLWKVSGLASSLSADDTFFDATAVTNVAQPVHHKADDYLYIFHDNIVRRLTDASTVSGVLLTLPSNLKIMGGGNYGNYLLIVASPIQQGTSNSVIFIWDRDSSLTTVSGKIDLGPGVVTYVSEAEDGGVWIVQENASQVLGFGAFNNAINVKYFNGSLQTLTIPNGTENEYFSQIRTIGSTYLPIGNAVESGGVFYFPAEIVTRLASESRDVIFAVRRTSNGLELIADQEITAAGGTGFYLNGIFEIGNHWLVSYTNGSGTILTEQTVTGSTYQTSVYETLIFTGDKRAVTKKLFGVSLFCSPLPSGGTMVLKYRADAETSWTTIFTDSTANDLYHSATNIESTGVTLPEFKEIQFRIESTGGTEITGFKFAFEEITNDIY